MVAVPAQGGITQLSTASRQATAARCMHPKDGRDGRRGGTQPPQGTSHRPGDSPGDGSGDSHSPMLTACGIGTAVNSWHSGGQGLGPSPWAPCCSSGSSGVARTPAHPMACQDDGEGMPGRREKHQEEMNSSSGGAGSGAGRRGEADGGQGSACAPLPAHLQGLSMGDGPGDSQGRGPDPQPSPNATCKGLGAAQPDVQRGYKLHSHAQAVSLHAPGPRHPLTLALPNLELVQAAPGGPGTAATKLVAPWGGRAGTRDRDAGTEMAPHPVYERWREETRSQGHVWQQLPLDQAFLPAGTGVPQHPATATASRPQPHGQGHPQMGGTQHLGEPLTLQAPTWGSVPPPIGGEARDLRADTCPPPSRIPAPSAGMAAMPAARQEAQN